MLVGGRGLLRVPELAPVTVAGLPGDWETLTIPWSVEGPCAQAWCRAALDLGTLTLGAAEPAARPDPGEAPALVELASEVAALRDLHALRARAGWRAPFQRLLIAPDGVPVSLSRGAEGTGQLVRGGVPPRVARVSVSPSPSTFPGVLALNPQGHEAYLLAWPGAVLRAFDPLTLESRWTLSLDAPAQGLFVDPTGRFLVAETGPLVPDRFVDWPLPAVDPAPPFDPAADPLLRQQDRPPAARTVVVDLAARAILLDARGRLRRWLGDDPARYVLATDQELVIHTPRSPS